MFHEIVIINKETHRSLYLLLRFIVRSLILSFALISLNLVSAHAADTPIPAEISDYLAKQGPVTLKKVVDGSTQNQLVVFFCVDENQPGGKTEGASNPASWHCEVTLFSKKSKHWVLGDKHSLGQGSVKTFSNNTLVAESVTYANDDPLCCPSIKKILTFNTQKGKLSTKKP